TLGSVLVVYGARLWRIVRGVAGRRPEDLRTAGLLVLGTVPAGVIGALFHHQVEAAATSLVLVGTGFILTGFMNWSTRRLGGRAPARRRLRPGLRERDLEHPVPRGAAPARAFLRVRPLLLDGRRAHDPVRAVALTLDGVPAGELAGRWHVPRCDLHPRLGSALDAIHALAAQGAPPGTTVIAEEQTAGRGRDGRTWHSPAGGVWLGMLLKPARSELAAVAIRAGLAVADAVDALLGRPETRLKWPNDALLGDRKLAGILCEGRWQGNTPQWLALGVGVNVRNAIPASLRSP